MTADGILVAWEEALVLTGQMLEAARSSDWDRLVEHERARDQLLERLRRQDRDVAGSARQRARKREILQAMLEQDEAVRLLTQDWMRELREILASVSNSQRLGRTYSGS